MQGDVFLWPITSSTGSYPRVPMWRTHGAHAWGYIG
jgi:hypothetical protein